MENSARFEYLATPIEFSIEDIDAAHLEAFVVTGIVNPFGPTLTALATVGRSDKRPLVYIMLNPFRCEVKQVGTFFDGDNWFPDQDFAHLFQFLSGSCPTLVLTSLALDAETRSRVTEKLLAQFDDAGDVIEHVREYFGNPVDRVSHSMGIKVPSAGSPPPEMQHAAWNEIVSDTRHIWPEIHALLLAWDGSINQTGISDQMRHGALQTERMKSILLPMLKSVWMPEPEPREHSSRRVELERPLPEPDNFDEIRGMLRDHGSWMPLRGDALLQFMEWSMLLYGRTEDSSLVPDLFALYSHVKLHTDTEHRKLQLPRISLAGKKYGLAACTYLPPLVCDGDPWVVATAMIDYISLCHPDSQHLPHEFSELDRLFSRGTFECPGGALGGLITSGDRRFHPKIHEWKRYLQKDDIRAATNCRTPFITHGEVLFWLDWAEELVSQHDDVSEGIFGLVASAIGLLGKHNPYNIIRDVERRYPAHDVEQTVVSLRSWTFTEYANEIGDRLYRLEAAEAAPKVFSAVIRAWGLQPRADLMDQFIPEEGS